MISQFAQFNRVGVSVLVLSLFGWGLDFNTRSCIAADRDQSKSPTAPRDAQEPTVAEGNYLTTKQGQRIEDDDNSLKAGA